MARPARAAAEPSGQGGTALIGSLAGFVVFIVLLLLAVQVVFDLYARSAVTAAAFDAARRVAGYDVATLAPDQLAAAEVTAQEQARHTLGRYGTSPDFAWTLTPDVVELRVRVKNPSLLPGGISRGLGIDTIDRTVRVHMEHLVCSAPGCRPDPSPAGGGAG